MDQNNEQKNEQTDQAPETANTGDGSQPAGEKTEQATAKIHLASKQDQDQDQDHTGDIEDNIKEVGRMLQKVIATGSNQNFKLICDQHSETTEALANLTELVKSENEKSYNQIINLTTDRQADITEALTNLTELVQTNRANNEIIKQQVGAISGVVIEISRLTQEIYSKVMQ